MAYLEKLEKAAAKYRNTYGADNAMDLFVDMYDEGMAFGVKTEMVELCTNDNIYTQPSMGDLVMISRFNVVTIEVGKKYFVRIKDREFVFEAEETNYSTVGDIVKIGADITGSYTIDTSVYPIAIYTKTNGDTVLVAHNELCNDKRSRSMSISIYEEQEVVKQLDSKFVGASGGVVVVNIEEVLGEEDMPIGIKTSISVDEMVTMAQNGATIIGTDGFLIYTPMFSEYGEGYNGVTFTSHYAHNIPFYDDDPDNSGIKNISFQAYAYNPRRNDWTVGYGEIETTPDGATRMPNITG